MIYLDNAATTACAPEVVEAMLPFFREAFGNASSIDHLAGSAAKSAVEQARHSVAKLVKAKPEDVIFTSGSTEANNLVLSVDSRILTTEIEHPSILVPFLARNKSHDSVIKVDRNGILDLDQLEAFSLKVDVPTLVSVIATNNEVGTEQPIHEIQRIIAGRNGFLHLDATQAIGTQETMITDGGVSAISLSAHKIHGPKGVGALIASAPLRRTLHPTMKGGGQERGSRSGTLNVPAIVGFGIAAQLLADKTSIYRNHLANLRKLFLAGLRANYHSEIIETVPANLASPHILSLRFPNVNGRALLGAVSSDLAFSLGSACATNKAEPSHVLLAMGRTKGEIAKSVRISFSREQSATEVERAAVIVAKAANRLCTLAISS